MPWFKCDPVAFNDGMEGLSPAERGAYVTALNCIYARGAPSPESEVRGRLGCAVAEWTPLLKALLKRGKLRALVVKGVTYLMNDRAGAEIQAYSDLIAAKARAGRASVKARGLTLRTNLRVVENDVDEQ